MLEKKPKKIRSIISCINIKNIGLILLIILVTTLPIVFIFIFALERTWADGLSIAAVLCLCLSLLAIIFKFSQFKTFHKLKQMFQINKQNKEEFTKLEQQQMKVLNISFKPKKYNSLDNKSFYFIFCITLIYGFIILLVSVPFLFIT